MDENNFEGNMFKEFGISEKTVQLGTEAQRRVKELGLNREDVARFNIEILRQELKGLEEQRNALVAKGNLSKYEEAYLNILESSILFKKEEILKRTQELLDKEKGNASLRR